MGERRTSILPNGSDLKAGQEDRITGRQGHALRGRAADRGACARGIHTAIETAFNAPWAFVVVVLHDHKVTDPERHREWIGGPNQRILEKIQLFRAAIDRGHRHGRHACPAGHPSKARCRLLSKAAPARHSGKVGHILAMARQAPR
jgi:hypothetical protein